MNLRDPDAYDRFRWDWTPLNDCFSRGIHVGDVDGIVEAGGRVLLIEGKHARGSYGRGQRMLYDALIARGIDVVIFWGDPTARPQTIVRMQIYPGPIRESSWEDFAAWVAAWFRRASA